MKLFDLGAIVYFAKQIVWNFPDVSVNKCFEQIKDLGEEINQRGYVSSREHRFLTVEGKK